MKDIKRVQGKNSLKIRENGNKIVPLSSVRKIRMKMKELAISVENTENQKNIRRILKMGELSGTRKCIEILRCKKL